MFNTKWERILFVEKIKNQNIRWRLRPRIILLCVEPVEDILSHSFRKRFFGSSKPIASLCARYTFSSWASVIGIRNRAGSPVNWTLPKTTMLRAISVRAPSSNLLKINWYRASSSITTSGVYKLRGGSPTRLPPLSFISALGSPRQRLLKALSNRSVRPLFHLDSVQSSHIWNQFPRFVARDCWTYTPRQIGKESTPPQIFIF